MSEIKAAPRLPGRIGRGIAGTVSLAYLLAAGAVFPAGLVHAGQADREEFSKLVYAGQIEAAYKLVADSPPEIIGEDFKALQPAFEAFARHDRLRRERKHKTYQETVAKAEKELAAGDVEKTLSALRKAKFYADDEGGFGEQEFVKQVVAEALLAAEKHLADNEWLKAGNIYAELSTIYPDHELYESKTKDCAKRIRLENTYAKDTEWRESLREITLNVIPDAIGHVEDKHVDRADLKELALGGIEALVLFTQMDKLKETFPVLEDPGKTKAFDEQLAALVDQIKATKGHFTTLNFWSAFVRLVSINGETLELPQPLLIREFMDGALNELDPFTGVIWPYELSEFQKRTRGQFSGVGIQITMEMNKKLKVITPIFGTPAYQAGIVPDDLIVSINGESTEGISISQAVRKITGPKGTSVTLGILHPWADSPEEISIIRDTIIIHTVKGAGHRRDNTWRYIADADHHIGYIRITSFTGTTVNDLKRAIRQARRENMKGLILDLRFNPGGTLRAAVATANCFLSEGVIVSTKGRGNSNAYEKSADPNGECLDLPLVVLINGVSASGSEIVCGALKDYGRALVIGDRTFGKGSVQNVIPIADESAQLKLTTAYYYLPSGRCLHRRRGHDVWGVEPDITLKLTPIEVRDVILLQRDSEVIYNPANGRKITKTHPTTATAPTTSTTTTAATQPDDTYPRIDVQLETALLVMKTRLTSGKPWDAILNEQPETKEQKATTTSK